MTFECRRYCALVRCYGASVPLLFAAAWARASAGAAAACLGSVLSSTIRRVQFAMTTVPFRPDLTAFKVHFLIRTYHVFLTVMTGLLWPSAIEILWRGSEMP